jgi:hypothetical protein
MCDCSDPRALSFETLLTDPMTRMVMESDGVSISELVAVLETAGAARAQMLRQSGSSGNCLLPSGMTTPGSFRDVQIWPAAERSIA